MGHSPTDLFLFLVSRLSSVERDMPWELPETRNWSTGKLLEDPEKDRKQQYLERFDNRLVSSCWCQPYPDYLNETKRPKKKSTLSHSRQGRGWKTTRFRAESSKKYAMMAAIDVAYFVPLHRPKLLFVFDWRGRRSRVFATTRIEDCTTNAFSWERSRSVTTRSRWRGCLTVRAKCYCTTRRTDGISFIHNSFHGRRRCQVWLVNLDWKYWNWRLKSFFGSIF